VAFKTIYHAAARRKKCGS